MIRNMLFLGLAALALALAGIACEFSATTANITNAYLTTDPEGGEPTTVFFPDEPFYLIVDLANAPDSTRVKAVWVAVDVADVDANTVIDEAELETGDGRLTFDLTAENPWPVGSYKVDVYINDKLDRTLEFSVE